VGQRQPQLEGTHEQPKAVNMKLFNQLMVFLAVITITLVFSSCKQKQYLTGYYDYEGFSKACKWDYYLDEKYKPKEKWADSLSTIQAKDSLHLQIFLGCYCGDSKKWVPRFFSMQPDLPISRIEIISVDTTKKDEKNLSESVGLKKIPTFIFYQGNSEVGRIVEKPKGRLEKNLFMVLKKCE
jgi:hypothetical protein